MTEALDRQMAKASEEITLILRDLPARIHVAVFVHALERRGDITGEILESLGNQVGRLGHKRSARNAPVTPLEPVALIEGPKTWAAE